MPLLSYKFSNSFTGPFNSNLSLQFIVKSMDIKAFIVYKSTRESVTTIFY